VNGNTAPDVEHAKPPSAAEESPQPAAAEAQPQPTPSNNDPYAGASSRQVNVRWLEPLYNRYAALVTELAAEGYKTTLTELLHALLDAGPTTPTEARQLVRTYRRRREP
jgi:hypothetical protein